MKLRSTLLAIIILVVIIACVPKVEEQAAPAESPQETQQQVEEPTADVIGAVYESARLLGVPEQHIRVVEKNGRASVRMPHNGDEMELALAGGVVAGQVELSGCQILRSETRDGGWVVEAKAPDGTRYVITLGGGTPLAIIVDDFGMISGSQLQDFCRRTPPEVTFAIIPDTPCAVEAMNLGHDTGHELMIHMPMQAMSANASTTPHDLTLDMTSNDIRKRVQRWVDDLPLCVGANNHQGSAFTSSAEAMTPVIEVLRENGYYFIDSRTYKDTQAYATATRMGVPAAQRRSFLDVPGVSDADLDAKISELKKLREKHESVVAITHCFPEAKLDFLVKLIDHAEAEGFVLVPASQVVTAPLP